MYTIAVLLACVGATWAAGCCIPPQWEATTSFVISMIHNDKLVVAPGYSMMAYDGVNKVLGQYETVYLNSATPRSYGVLLDYKTNTKYTLNSEGACYRSTLNRDVAELSGCIPNNATMVSQNIVIGIGSNSMKVDTYKFNFEGSAAFVTVSSENCIPVKEVIRGSLEGNNFIQDLQYQNITGGISHPENLVVPPKGCENAPMFSAHFASDGFMGNVIGRRSVFLGL
ncbi:hypothetical protein ACF0H5_001209 [Mactra antiquata]